MELRVKTIYDSGTAIFLEDRIIVQPPFFGVLDGVSGLYNPTTGPNFFDGKTGGQKAVDIVQEFFSRAKAGDDLSAVIKSANAKLREFSQSNGIELDRADLLPGMMFAFAKITENEVEIIQAGDSYAAWEKINGEIGVTPNQNFFDEEEKIEILNKLIEKHGGDYEKIWAEYMPISAKLRIERVNKNLPKRLIALNGQLAGENYWYKIILPRRELKILLLFTDGMAKFSESRDAEAMGKAIFSAYHRQNLAGMLARIREIENMRSQPTHIKNAEATAIAVEF